MIGIASAITTRPAASSRHRARWAAVGAALAVTLGAGGLNLVEAASTPATVRAEPLDFRPASSGIDTSTNVARHTLLGHVMLNESADGFNRCASAPLDLPDGAALKAVEIRYGAPNGGVLQSQVAASAFSERTITAQADLIEPLAERVDEVKPDFSIRTITIDVGAIVDNTESHHHVTICSDELLTIHGALAHLG